MAAARPSASAVLLLQGRPTAVTDRVLPQERFHVGERLPPTPGGPGFMVAQHPARGSCFPSVQPGAWDMSTAAAEPDGSVEHGTHAVLPIPPLALATPEPPTCVRFDGYLRVSAPGLTAAFVPTLSTREVRPAGVLAASVLADELVAQGGPPGRCAHGDTRSCGCGTQHQTCFLGRWGRCQPGPEVCNGCNDDRDGAVDEGTNLTCDDAVPCTVDFCFAGACQNLERPQVCRRGNCTRGVCLGVAGPGPSDIDPRVRPFADGNGCSYDESDARCESFDNCNCNGMAICQGAIGPTWSGIYPLSGAERGLLTTSQASCRSRFPLEPRYPPNDSRFVVSLCNGPCPTGQQCVSGQCYPVRNGGCETSGNACTIDDMCLEPNPATSACARFVGAPGSPGATLRATQQALLDLVNERSSTIDELAVACVGDILGQDLPPAPFHLWCQNDGLACTVPFNVPANTTGSGCSVIGVPQADCVSAGPTPPCATGCL